MNIVTGRKVREFTAADLNAPFVQASLEIFITTFAWFRK